MLMIKSAFICAIKNRGRRALLPLRTVRGFTLTEVVMATAIAAIVFPILTVLIVSTGKGFTNYEAASSMKQLNQTALNRIYLRLGRSKRLFENDTYGRGLLGRLNTAAMPSVLGGSKLPTVEEAGSLSPDATGYVRASFGNRLFFVYLSESREIAISGSDNWRVDLYKFASYYLTSSGAQQINGVQAYNLLELESGQYADCKQITALTANSSVRQLNTNLLAAGINTCYQTDSTDYTLAFSSINAAGTITAVSAHRVNIAKNRVLSSVTTGIMGRGYSYGISPNTSVWSGAQVTVPIYGTAASAFPGGFEVGIVGGANGRQVLVRSVAVAQGEKNALVFNDMIIVSSARDIW